jgi:drug/metabolite transporter (DMT)-like permease
LTENQSSKGASLQGIYLILLSTIVFTVMDGFVKWTADSYPVIQLLFFRCVFALIPITLILWKTGNFRHLKTAQPFKHILRGCVGMLAMFFVFTSYTVLPLADVVTILFAAPLLTTVLAIPILGERIGLHRAIAIIVGFIGVLIVVQPGSGLLSSAVLYPIAAATCMACAMLTVRVLGRTDHGAVISFYFTLFGIVVACVGLAFEGWVMPRGIDWALLIAIGLLGGLGQYFLTSAYAIAEVAVISPFKYTALIWAAGIAYFIWGEVPAWQTWLGAGVIVFSSLYMLHREVYWANKDKPNQDRRFARIKSRVMVFLQRG